MEDLFQHLEKRIQKLLQKFEHVKMSNLHLQQGKLSLVHEKERLLIKQKHAVTQIEGMIAKLKSIEGL